MEKVDCGEIKHYRKLRFSAVFPEDRLIATLSAINNIRYVTRDEKRIAQVLDIVGLTESASKLPREMSTGMNRRISLARALAFPCDVLILDEPFKGLDKELRERILEKLCEYSKNVSVLLVSHNIDMLKDVSGNLLNLK